MYINIDEILNRAKDMVNVAAKKTNDVVEVSKLKLEAAKLQGELKALYAQLGIEAYDSKKEFLAEDAVCKEIMDEIDALLEKIDAVNETVADRQNTPVCPECGAKTKVEHFYCPICGTPLKEKQAEDSVKAEPVEEEECCCETTACEESACECGCESAEQASVDPVEEHMNQQDW